MTKIIGSSFTVNTVEGGVTYSIVSTVPSVTIASNATSAALSTQLSFYKKEGDTDAEPYSCYYAAFFKKGTAYTLIKNISTKGTGGTLSTTCTSSYDSVVICIYDAAKNTHDGYLAELEITINKQGDKPDYYELAAAPDAFHISTNGEWDNDIQVTLWHIVGNERTATSSSSDELIIKIGELSFRQRHDQGGGLLLSKGSALSDIDSSVFSNFCQDVESGDYTSVTISDATHGAADLVLNISFDGVKGNTGNNSVRIDLDNENDSMQYTSGGTKVGTSNITSTATLFDGYNNISDSSAVTWNVVATNCTLESASTSRNIEVSALSANEAYVTVNATYKKTTYTAKLTLHKLIDQDKYELVVTPTSVAYNSTTGEPSGVDITAKIYKTDMTGSRTLSAPPKGYYLVLVTQSPTGGYTVLTSTDSLSSTGSGIVPKNCQNVVVYIGTSTNINASGIKFLDYETIPIVSSENGSQGPAGNNTAIVYLYKRSASAITSIGFTSNLVYSFADKKITSTIPNGWSQTIPATDGNPLYVTAATAYGNGTTDTIPYTSWATPVKYVEDGAQGGHGMNTATVFLYQRSSGSPSKPTSSLIYTFATGKLSGTLGSWSQSIPSGSNPCYVIQATAISTSDTDTIAASEWEGPTKLVENGSQGNSPVTYSIIVASASAVVGANGLLNVAITASITKTVGSTNTPNSTEGTLKAVVGSKDVSMGSTASRTLKIENGDWKNTYGSPKTIVLQLSVSNVIVASISIPITITGQMSRNIYYAGTLDEVKGTSFAATDYQAPYVWVNGTASAPKCYVYVGDNGTISFPTAESGYTNSNDWSLMESNFKYLITNAIFSEFAKLGSAVFNKDFMYSAYVNNSLTMFAGSQQRSTDSYVVVPNQTALAVQGGNEYQIDVTGYCNNTSHPLFYRVYYLKEEYSDTTDNWTNHATMGNAFLAISNTSSVVTSIPFVAEYTGLVKIYFYGYGYVTKIAANKQTDKYNRISPMFINADTMNLLQVGSIAVSATSAATLIGTPIYVVYGVQYKLSVTGYASSGSITVGLYREDNGNLLTSPVSVNKTTSDTYEVSGTSYYTGYVYIKAYKSVSDATAIISGITMCATNPYIPTIAINWLTGYAHFAGDNVRFNPDGSGWLAGTNINWNKSGDLKIKGDFYHPPFVITNSNASTYAPKNSAGCYEIDLTKTGFNIQVELSISYNNVIYMDFPISNDYIGAECTVINLSSSDIEIYSIRWGNADAQDGYIIHKTTGCAKFRCVKKTSGTNPYWIPISEIYDSENQ